MAIAAQDMAPLRQFAEKELRGLVVGVFLDQADKGQDSRDERWRDGVVGVGGSIIWGAKAGWADEDEVMVMECVDEFVNQLVSWFLVRGVCAHDQDGLAAEEAADGGLFEFAHWFFECVWCFFMGEESWKTSCRMDFHGVSVTLEAA